MKNFFFLVQSEKLCLNSGMAIPKWLQILKLINISTYKKSQKIGNKFLISIPVSERCLKVPFSRACLIGCANSWLLSRAVNSSITSQFRSLLVSWYQNNVKIFRPNQAIISKICFFFLTKKKSYVVRDLNQSTILRLKIRFSIPYRTKWSHIILNKNYSTSQATRKALPLS